MTRIRNYIGIALIAVMTGLAPVQVIMAQSYDLLLKGGHVIDPKNGINEPLDIAIKDTLIVRVSPDIPDSESRKVIDASGLYVAPGLIDVHAHVFFGSMPGKGFAGGASSVSPDAFSFRTGITTVVDAGDSGWRNFPELKKQVIDQSDTRVLAFLNIFGRGLTSGSGIYEMDDIDVERTRRMIEQYPSLIVGTRVGHFLGDSWSPFEAAAEAARHTDRPLLVECHMPELPLSGLMNRMRPGDIFTHAFGEVNDRESILDDDGRLRPYVKKGREKGILFDVGHGGGSFHYSQAIPAMEQGLLPDTFGTDLHRYSMNGGMKDMLNIMSRYLNLGMSMEDLIRRGSWNAARMLGRDELGHLSEGAVADVAILGSKKGKFGFIDSAGYKIEGDRKLEAELTIRAGEIVWDQNGLAAASWEQQVK